MQQFIVSGQTLPPCSKGMLTPSLPTTKTVWKSVSLPYYTSRWCLYSTEGRSLPLCCGGSHHHNVTCSAVRTWVLSTVSTGTGSSSIHIQKDSIMNQKPIRGFTLITFLFQRRGAHTSSLHPNIQISGCFKKKHLRMICWKDPFTFILHTGSFSSSLIRSTPTNIKSSFLLLFS